MKKILLATVFSLMVSASSAQPQDPENKVPEVVPEVATTPAKRTIPDKIVSEINVPISCGPAEEVIGMVRRNWGTETLFMSLAKDKSSLIQMFFDPKKETWAVVTLRKLEDNPKACVISHGEGLVVNPTYSYLLKSSTGI